MHSFDAKALRDFVIILVLWSGKKRKEKYLWIKQPQGGWGNTHSQFLCCGFMLFAHLVHSLTLRFNTLHKRTQVFAYKTYFTVFRYSTAYIKVVLCIFRPIYCGSFAPSRLTTTKCIIFCSFLRTQHTFYDSVCNSRLYFTVIFVNDGNVYECLRNPSLALLLLLLLTCYVMVGYYHRCRQQQR